MDVHSLPPAEGKFASTVKVGAKGQIVIPKGARDLFNIEPGDTLLFLADAQQGMTIMRQEVFDKFITEAMFPRSEGAPPAQEDVSTQNTRNRRGQL
ncbi:MAG: AbrB/MazE/SpoVT family DNA-binding domain-containing protein [Canibacter sp.]